MIAQDLGGSESGENRLLQEPKFCFLQGKVEGVGQLVRAND